MVMKLHLYETLMSLKRYKFSKDDSLRYDQNIQEYVRKINRYRGNVVLKYFQYLPVLLRKFSWTSLKTIRLSFKSAE